MSNGTVTWDDIKGFFTDIDIDHMKGVTGNALDLSDCESVQHWAKQIYVAVSEGSMPPGNPWPADMVDKFKRWMDAGALCPEAPQAPQAAKAAKATKKMKARKRR
jgi:hypothetical protein